MKRFQFLHLFKSVRTACLTFTFIGATYYLRAYATARSQSEVVPSLLLEPKRGTA